MKKFLLFFVSVSLFFGSVNRFASAGESENWLLLEKNVLAKAAVYKNSGFTLKDQNDNAYAVKFPRDKVTVLIFGDRDGAEQIEGWVRPIYNQYSNRVDVFGIAELSAVPSLARGIVRRIIKRKTKYSVLLDWSGSVSKAYGYETGKATVVVIDKNGNVLAKSSGAANNGKLRGIYGQINRRL